MNPVTDGIILVNKPQGLTSNAVLQRVKRLFEVKKAGHTGSLDPLATGMLPICFGEATKFCQYLLDADKSYDVTALLGVTTDTGDAMGTVLTEAPSAHCTLEMVNEAVKKFTGLIKQVPPMYSALKHQGKPLYRYARAGKVVERPAREVYIRAIEHLVLEGSLLSFTVTCSKGTYIRSLVEDIGSALGVGAHVTSLHRRFTAGFEKERMWTLDELLSLDKEHLSALLLPMSQAVEHFSFLQISSAQIEALRHGKVISGFQKKPIHTLYVRLYDECNNFVGLGEWFGSDQLKVKRLISF